ncbi:MAG: alpha/beta hydrolase [Promethearchaeota archaeon]
MTVQYMEGAEPLLIKGSNTGCLLLHGAGGGTTWDLKEFAHNIHSKTGYTIWLPALKGFGTRPEDLFNVSFSDWWNDAQEGIQKLKQDCDQICVVGHSMGGLLTLLLASKQNNITAIVTWAAPYNTRHRQLKLLPITSKIPLLKRIIPEKYSSPALELRQKGWVGYDWIPSLIGMIVLEGLKRLKQSLHNVNCPAFIIQGTEDKDVSDDSARKIYQTINSSIKELWYVEGAPHPIMTDESYKDELFSRTIEFLEGSK